jgi:hypothetical protein
MTPELADLFDRARKVEIEAIAGVKLARVGRRLRGPCVVCGASKGKKAGGAFWVDPSSGRWGCFAAGGDCRIGGDAVDLERILRGGTNVEAAERLVGPALAQAAAPAPRPAPAAASRTASGLAEQIWRATRPADGTPVEAYLRGRGLAGPWLEAALRRLRFAPRAWWGGTWREPIERPAMVAQVVTPGGPTGGIHATYLGRAGGGAWIKAQCDPAKRMLGPQTDDEARPGGAWLIGPAGAGPLYVGEGIESTLSAAQLAGVWPCRAVAALALNRLQGGWLVDKWGRIDPDVIAGDPERPPFTWPAPAVSPWPAIHPAVDRDMGAIRVKARQATGGSYQRELGAEDRARICAGLAEQAWRRASPHLAANAVRAIAPSAGRDFNTELQARGGNT